MSKINLNDIAEAWEILHRARTTIRDVKDEGFPEGSELRINKALHHLENAQSYLGKYLASEKIGLDKMAGAGALGYPSDMADKRADKGE
ncbi:hypothetical protein [Pseudomonas sp. NPDC087817]|uniref:hypothetical protein n=1 Tax=Pseudomonas sp. NPDC087817 TaxID=3364451 RepID=UPI0038242135